MDDKDKIIEDLENSVEILKEELEEKIVLIKDMEHRLNQACNDLSKYSKMLADIESDIKQFFRFN